MKLQTIDEIMKGKQPGEVKVVHKSRPKEIFTPYFHDRHNNWCGLTDSPDFTKAFSAERGDDPSWTIYTPPKKTVTKYLWAIHYEGIGWAPIAMFWTEEEMAAQGYQAPVKKLDYTATDFPED